MRTGSCSGSSQEESGWCEPMWRPIRSPILSARELQRKAIKQFYLNIKTES